MRLLVIYTFALTLLKIYIIKIKKHIFANLKIKTKNKPIRLFVYFKKQIRYESRNRRTTKCREINFV